MSKLITPLVAVVMAAAFALASPAKAGDKKFAFIRDAEIENTIRTFAAPVFSTAGLAPEAVQVYLVNDKSLNAFVAGGQKLFIHTGLLMRSENPGQVIGVIAHETGHIAGGHLARTHDAIKDATAQSILGYVLGGAAAVAGRPDVAGAVMMGSQQVGQRSFLQYSRTQEAAADQAALKFLDETGQSSRGLLEFMEILGDQELLSESRQDPYVRTHPLSRDRVSAIQAHVEKSPMSSKTAPPDLVEQHARMKAKLVAFLEPLPRTLRQYPEKDGSLVARYARAIAYYRRPELDKAVPLIDGLIAERPGDPYFYELKGQMLFENGRIREAMVPYEMAVRLLPQSALLRRELAQVQVELENDSLLGAAIGNLESALQRAPDDSFSWHLLAIAYGRKGDMGMSALAMAEESLLKGDRTAARYHAGKAEGLLKHGSRGWLKAQDIMAATDKKEGE